jgi:hypothetical protein
MFAAVVIAALGIAMFFFSHVFYEIYDALEVQLEGNPDWNNTEATDTIENIKQTEQSGWDYAFLGVALSYVILIGIFSFQTPSSPIFFWISVILSIIGLFLGVIMGRVWQAMAANPELADTVARFPITNTLLGTYYPLFITFLIVMGLILLYGKPVGGTGR